MLKILFLAPRVPLPIDTGGKIRTFNILKQLAKDNKVHLVCFSFEKDDEAYANELRVMGIEVTLVVMKNPSFIRKILAVLFSKTPFSMAKYFTSLMLHTLQEILASRTYDVIHVDHLHMGLYRDCFRNIPCILDEHNVEYKILERCGQVEKSFIKKQIYINQSSKMRIFEEHCLKYYNAITACSIDDQHLINKLNHGLVPCHVVPNGVDTDFFNGANHPDQNSEEALVFTGSMDWLPNDDAITYFCRDILPLIWMKNNSVKLYVVGKSPSAAVKELTAKDNRVIVTGRVDDVRTYMARAKVFIVPLRIGGGTRLKILEAMAMHKAIVSTKIGAEGISYTNHKNIMIADSPEEYAASVLAVLNDCKHMESLGEEGRKLVCASYDWAIIGSKLNKLYKDLTNDC